MRTLLALLLLCVPAYADMKDDCASKAVETLPKGLQIGTPHTTNTPFPPGWSGWPFRVEIDTAADKAKVTHVYVCDFQAGRPVVKRLLP